ncbi:hypothetical protein BDZ91DRAFT_845126 [Kalaharituber pfeilii]|nr:hypothetical protein BDZ91DRAFT_845126 [Kalaharituber pfeilii]
MRSTGITAKPSEDLIDDTSEIIIVRVKKFPWIRTVALLDVSTVLPEDCGVSEYSWLGGIDLEKDSGESHSLGTVSSPTYMSFVNAEVVKEAHKFGLQVDDEVNIDKLVIDGIDIIISNYPKPIKYIVQDCAFLIGSKRCDPKPHCLKNAVSPS